MRAILVSTLLLITVIILYQAVAEGDAGMKGQINGAGSAIREHIRGMSP
ncbi:hypothetical protein [Paenibacillus sp. sgz302251]